VPLRSDWSEATCPIARSLDVVGDPWVLLVRTPYVDQRRTRHEYLLTDAGRDLLPVVQALALWGERHRPRSAGRLEVVHEGCGATSQSADTCIDCGTRLTPDTVSWRRPRAPGTLTPLVR